LVAPLCSLRGDTMVLRAALYFMPPQIRVLPVCAAQNNQLVKTH